MRQFELVGEITSPETFAEGHGIRNLAYLLETYGGKNWRKRKGFAVLRHLETGRTRGAEIHWYEAHGIGKVELKVKEWL